MKTLIGVLIYLLAVSIVAIGILSFVGCASFRPCTYNGERISQHEANKMKLNGMHVECPGDEYERFAGKKPLP